MPGTLFVVATPIGNLEDITLRALRILREVAVVAAEDTRRTGNLLRHYQIETPLLSLHEHNERHRLDQIVERLRRGDSVALVSDAGTPGISDPGAILVQAARKAGIRVDPIPGASAVTALLSAAGLPMERFAFAGFPPVRSKDRKNWFSWVSRLPDTPVVCFEAPHRIARTLRELREILVNRPIIIGRELTKAHEEWIFNEKPPQERGEFVILIGQTPENTAADDGGRATGSKETPIDAARVADVFGEITNNLRPPSRRAAIKAVAERLGMSPKAVYDALERAKN
jgi:16S rRNA (cytidine1402-2'-O)-methyltransferase